MRSLFKHIFVFFIAFCVAGGIAFYAVRMFTNSADEVILPELTGKNIIYVLETLTHMGLNAKLQDTLYDETIPLYSVISQTPPPGATIKKGRDVSIYLSKGKKETLVPDLRLTALEEARLQLEEKQLRTGHISYTFTPDVQKGKIIAQYPEPFSTAFKGITCNLLVSRGKMPEGRIMPDLKNQTIQTAAFLMGKHQLTISKVSSLSDPRKESGIVLSQTPEAGNFVSPETPVILKVNGSKSDQTMSPDRLRSLTLIQYSLDPGLLKSHVRVETDMFGPYLDLYSEYMKPGHTIQILVPSENITHIHIFIDHKLEKTIILNPWEKDTITGEVTPWELSPPQFYLPISHN